MPSREVTIKIHEIATDGLPEMEELTGRVAFLFDGCVVSGWPLWSGYNQGTRVWEADSDVGHTKGFAGVTHWIEFPETIKHYEMENNGQDQA